MAFHADATAGLVRRALHPDCAVMVRSAMPAFCGCSTGSRETHKCASVFLRVPGGLASGNIAQGLPEKHTFKIIDVAATNTVPLSVEFDRLLLVLKIIRTMKNCHLLAPKAAQLGNMATPGTSSSASAAEVA